MQLKIESIALRSQCGMQVNTKYIAEDLVLDFDAGLEYGEADCVLDMEEKGTTRRYLIR